VDRLRNYAQTGILDFATKLEPEIAIKDVPNLLEVLGKNLDIKNMTRRFDGDSIEYSYALGEYQGSVVIGSYKRIYSNASCNALSVNGNEVYYWADGRTENIGEFPTSGHESWIEV
jgi:hypothetical protein